MQRKVTKEELIIRTMPFSPELKEWCLKHPDFSKALKINNPERFVHLGTVSNYYSPLFPEDGVIGVYALDFKFTPEKFKQDFIVNKGKRNEEFVLYTRLPGRKYSKYIRDINEFFSTYGKGLHYTSAHWFKFEELPEEKLKERAVDAIRIANNIRGGVRDLTQEELDDFDSKIPK